MSLWDQLDMTVKIEEILRVRSHSPRHHFGRPFLSPYQIAIAFRARFPEDFQIIAKPVGGKGTGQQDSLAQYIALELSRRIKKRDLPNIEGRFLHRAALHGLMYQDGNRIIKSSSMTSYDLSIFRLRD